LKLDEKVKQKVYKSLGELQELFTKYSDSGETKNPPS
jgi:hypothetical protein